jgi:hypothetical protein
VSSEATPSDPDDEIFNKAEVRFSAELARRPEVLRAAAWRGNWAVGLMLEIQKHPFRWRTASSSLTHGRTAESSNAGLTRKSFLADC